MRILIGNLLIVHGLIVAGQAAGGAWIQNPAWLQWWPIALGQFWQNSKQYSSMGVDSHDQHNQRHSPPLYLTTNNSTQNWLNSVTLPPR